MAHWEESKAMRRTAILAAARELMNASDGVSFSMRKLAQMADVSVATPYNLFGSKQAILSALLKEDTKRLETYLEDKVSDELEAFFTASAVMSFVYEQHPAYHRNLLSAAFQNGGPDTRREMGASAVQLWRKLLEEAVGAGYLAGDVSPRSFAITFGELLLVNTQIWAHGLISIGEMKVRNQFGASLLLLGIATKKGRDRLLPYRVEAEQALETYWDAAPGENRDVPEGKKSGSISSVY